MWGSEKSRAKQEQQDKIFFQMANPGKIAVSLDNNTIVKEKSEEVKAIRNKHQERRKVYDQSFESLFGDSIIAESENPEMQVYRKELHEALKKAWEDKRVMQPNFREVLYKYFFEGKPIGQIARECELKPAEITYRLDDALGRLRFSKYFKNLHKKNKQGKGNFEIN